MILFIWTSYTLLSWTLWIKSKALTAVSALFKLVASAFANLVPLAIAAFKSFNVLTAAAYWVFASVVTGNSLNTPVLLSYAQ